MAIANPSGQDTIRTWYNELDTDRRCMLDRKREHSLLSMPSLLPWEGRAVNTQLDVPYNSNIADGINALSSRIASVVFPLNGQSVFEIQNIAPFNPEGQDDSELDEVLNRFARYTMSQLAPTNLRSQVNLSYQHLIGIGDILIQQLDDFNFRLFRADQYVVRRKHEGDWVDIIIAERVNREFHPELIEVGGDRVDSGMSANNSQTPTEEPWEVLYTWIRKHPETQKICINQEFRDRQVGEAREEDVSEYMPVRWKALIGEAYGVSHIEDNFGDVRTLDAISKGLLDGILLNAEYRWGVNPQGFTELQDMLDSRNGDFVPIVPGDVFPLQFQNHSQVQATEAAKVSLQAVLDKKFLKSTTRNAERVTAREIQRDAQDLEAQLGGTLSGAARELQEPIIRHTLYLMSKKKMIPDSISKEIEKSAGLVNLRIRAGLEILNREAEREKLDGMIERIANMPPQAHEALEWTNIMKDYWASNGLETVGRVKSAEQLQQERQQRAQAQASQAAVVGAAQSVANGEPQA